MFKLYECISRVGVGWVRTNAWQFADAWYLYIRRWLQINADLTIDE